MPLHKYLGVLLGVIPFAGGSYLAYGILDSSIAKPPGDLTPVYMFISGCLAAAVAKVTFFTNIMSVIKKLISRIKQYYDNLL